MIVYTSIEARHSPPGGGPTKGSGGGMFTFSLDFMIMIDGKCYEWHVWFITLVYERETVELAAGFGTVWYMKWSISIPVILNLNSDWVPTTYES